MLSRLTITNFGFVPLSRLIRDNTVLEMPAANCLWSFLVWMLTCKKKSREEVRKVQSSSAVIIPTMSSWTLSGTYKLGSGQQFGNSKKQYQNITLSEAVSHCLCALNWWHFFENKLDIKSWNVLITEISVGMSTGVNNSESGRSTIENSPGPKLGTLSRDALPIHAS